MSYELPYQFADAPINNNGAYSTATIMGNFLSDGVEYKTSPICSGMYKSYRPNTTEPASTITLNDFRLNLTEENHQRAAIYYFSTGSNMGFNSANNSCQFYADGYWSNTFTYGGYGGGNQESILDTNVPVFSDSSKAQYYLSNISEEDALQYLLENAINAGSVVPSVNEDTVEYYIYNTYESAIVERGIPRVTSNLSHRANERILYNGQKIGLYRTASNPFMLAIKFDSNEDMVGSYYSATDNIADIPYDQFSSQLDYASPFYDKFDISLNVTDYEGYLAIGLATNLSIWDSESDINDYFNGTKDITEASNWDKISGNNAYKNIIDNLTEQPEIATEFGEVYVRNIFSQLYICDTAALYEISNNLFDYDVTTLSGVWDDIKKGLEMYGSNPMECVQGLRFYPFDLTTIFSNTQSQSYVYFGAYQLQLQNSSVHKVIYANGYKDLGSVTIKRTFKDWRDFEPYTKLSIYLPYVGRYQLDLNKYYDKTINIRYYLDIRTGACCACLIANGVLLDWFDGLIGTEMPITLTDYSSYAQNQINIIMRNAGIGITGEGAVGALGVKGVNAAMNYSAGEQGAAFANTYAAQGGGNAAFSAAQSASAAAGKTGAVGVAGSMGLMAAGMGVVALGVAEKTAFDMMRTGTAAYTKGRPGSSAMINQFLPQYPTFMFEIMEIDESPYLNELYGRPSNASGAIGDFSGYLEAEDVMLICPIATDNERQEIIDLVKSGIYI